MGRLGREEEEAVREGARVLQEFGRDQLADDLLGIVEQRPAPTVDEVPERIEEVVGHRVAFSKGDAASEQWAERWSRMVESERRRIWLLFRSRPQEGWTPRELVRHLGRDPGEALNSVRRIVQRFYEHRILEKHGTRVLEGRDQKETVRRLARPVRIYCGYEEPEAEREPEQGSLL